MQNTGQSHSPPSQVEGGYLIDTTLSMRAMWWVLKSRKSITTFGISRKGTDNACANCKYNT